MVTYLWSVPGSVRHNLLQQSGILTPLEIRPDLLHQQLAYLTSLWGVNFVHQREVVALNIA